MRAYVLHTLWNTFNLYAKIHIFLFARMLKHCSMRICSAWLDGPVRQYRQFLSVLLLKSSFYDGSTTPNHIKWDGTRKDVGTNSMWVASALRLTIKVNTDIRITSNNVNGNANEPTTRREERNKRDINTTKTTTATFNDDMRNAIVCQLFPLYYIPFLFFFFHFISSYLLLLHFSYRIIKLLLSITIRSNPFRNCPALSLSLRLSLISYFFQVISTLIIIKVNAHVRLSAG